MTGWDERHKAPIVSWKEISDLRLRGRQRHIIEPSGPHKLALDALVQPQDSDTLIVALHGALDPKVYSHPRFEWMGTLVGRSESLLFLSDPTITLSERLRLGWYVGTRTDNLIDRYAQLVRSIAVQCGATKVIFFGFSGGGFAALAFAAVMPGSIGLAFSPQTSIGSYYRQFSEMFAEDVFPEAADYSEIAAEQGDRVSLLERYADPHLDATFLYVQNSGDSHHVNKHYEPFHTLTAGRPGAHFRLSHDSDGHTVPSKEALFEALDECVSGKFIERNS